jgi:hypothetical protein
MVLVADGVRRQTVKPKKKNVKHLRIHSKPVAEISEKLAGGRRVSDLKVRELLRVFVEKEVCE